MLPLVFEGPESPFEANNHKVFEPVESPGSFLSNACVVAFFPGMMLISINKFIQLLCEEEEGTYELEAEESRREARSLDQ